MDEQVIIEKFIIEEFEILYKNITLLEFKEKKEIFKREFKKAKTPIVKRRWKKLIFNLKMADYKKEKIWEYLNDDMSKGAFDYFVDAVHKGWFK